MYKTKKDIETSKIKQANTVPSVQERQNDSVDLNEDDNRDRQRVAPISSGVFDVTEEGNFITS